MKQLHDGKKKGTVGRTLGLVFFLVLWLLSGSVGIRRIRAAGPEQTLEDPSVELRHSHTGEGGACYGTVVEPCGGGVYHCWNNGDTAVYGCVECGRLYFDDAPAVCDGYEVEALTCELSVLGSFKIRKVEREGESCLLAQVEDPDPAITDTDIRWDVSGAEEEDGGSLIRITENRTYSATLRWYDGQSSAWHEETLSYTDLSVPILLRVLDGDVLLVETELSYGEELPEVTVPQKEGYDFLGFFDGENMYYDADGAPADGDTCLSGGTLELDARWEVRTYELRYGEDADGDGLPDRILEVTYGENYDAVEIPAVMEGRSFEGYYLDGEMVFDANGEPQGIWRWDPEDTTLQPEYRDIPVEEGAGADEAVENEDDDDDDDENEDDDEDEEEEPAEAVVSVVREIPRVFIQQPEQDTGSTAFAESPEPELIAPEILQTQMEASVSENSIMADPDVDAAAGAGDGAWQQAAGDVHDDAAGEEKEPEAGAGEPAEAEPAAGASEGTEYEVPQTEAVMLPEAASAPGEEGAEEALAGRAPMRPGKVAAAAALTTGCLGGLAGIYAGMVYLFAMAEVDTICVDGRKRRLGRRNIRTEKGRRFRIDLDGALLQQCETDRLCIRIPAVFVLLHGKRHLTVRMHGKSRQGYLEKEIYMTIPEGVA